MVTLLAFVVLGGGAAYAGSQLAKNSVGARQLKKNSVTSAKVKDGSLKRRDFAKNQLAAGPRGPEGPQGPLGPRGAAGTSHVYQASGSVNFDAFSSSPFGSQVVSLPVPAGSYFVTATASVQSVNGTGSTVLCRLVNGSGGSAGTLREQAARSDGQVDNMTLAGGFAVADGQTLNLQCSKSVPASGARILAANIVAVQVGGVSGRPE